MIPRMRTLIVPDIHNHIENAEHWLSSQRYEHVVFLGDYFDAVDDNAGDARKTALWLRDRMDSTEDVSCRETTMPATCSPGSDQPYCPGFTRAKAKAIHEILKPEHWKRFKLAHEEQGWLLSHAGFYSDWITKPTVKKIIQHCDEAMLRAARGR